MKTTPRVEFVNRKFKIALSGYPFAESTERERERDREREREREREKNQVL